MPPRGELRARGGAAAPDVATKDVDLEELISNSAGNDALVSAPEKSLGELAQHVRATLTRRRTVALVNLVFVMERLDEALVPTLARPLGCAWRAGPAQLGMVTFGRALVQALVCPLGGLAGHYFDRVAVLCAGCMLWGCCSAAFAFARSVNQGIAAWAFNGVGLSLIIPNSQSLVADYYSANQRGEAFGTLMLTGALGGMVGGIYATNLGGVPASSGSGGLAGWQLVFLTVGAASAGVGVLVLLLGVDPRGPATPARGPDSGGDSGSNRGEAGVEKAEKGGDAVEGGGAMDTAAGRMGTAPAGGGGRAPDLTWRRLWRMLTTPTFLIIILQGIVGSTPWNALVFLTLYFQLLGFSDAAASGLVALFGAGAAAGSLLGGWLGDRVAERHPHHGRIALVQFSVAVGIPLTALLLRGLPVDVAAGAGGGGGSGGGSGGVVAYGAVLVAMGLLITWASPACNQPMFAEIVPPDMRNLVYAFDRALEGAISALGAPLVGMAAERWFGFSGVAAAEDSCEGLGLQLSGASPAGNSTAAAAVKAGGPAPDLLKARSLGDAMLLFMVVPWTLCALFYTGLHWTYPRDRARALRPQ
ncbi:hypothetical protein HXX76_013015 [Chlamydomonas incerta]|uniref:Major facilitator superfamily (MFS) profile domain-containing protein n=1 Tax=Chlamydomonas incerta TaxID=51695 RepID=A0A835SJT1_CHLIN|nr:hypothetical protein HXX76_013015 [Chlamydomonas incerta]|eukprot:KAG2426257.1 hypothetical protein HXX76_013015 [Chlamydomonas incerta]